MPQPTLTEDAVNLIEQLNRRHHDLQYLQIPRLRDYQGSLAGQQQHAAELREDMERFSQLLQSLELLIDDQPRQHLREELAVKVDEYKRTFEQLRLDSRMALLTSKRTMDSLAQSNRAALLSTAMREEKFNEKENNSTLMDASNNVTEALQRTLSLMQGELQRSVLSVQMLEESSTNLRSTTAVHDTLGTLLDTSKHLIVALQKSDWTDRLLLFGSLLFFFSVCFFILKQRVLDKTFRAAFWWTRFLPDFSKRHRDIESDTVPSLHSISTELSSISSTLDFEDISATLSSSIVETLISTLAAHEEL